MSNHDPLTVHTLKNGITVIHEAMPWLASTSITISLPYGSALDPDERIGAHLVAAEWLQRGAGERTARQLADYFDSIGAMWSVSPGRSRLTISARCLAADISAVLTVLADIVQRPQLATPEFAPAKGVIREELRAQQDNYTRRLLDTLVTTFVSGPIGRSTHGTLETLDALTADDVVQQVHANIKPNGIVIAVAGGGTAETFTGLIGEHFGAWEGGTPRTPTAKLLHGINEHIAEASEQTHIAFGWGGPDPANTNEALLAQYAAQVLSGGMGARLFTEVREKRGLVYAVSASYQPIAQYGTFIGYAGTTPERAVETRTVYEDVIRSLADGITEAEFARAKTGLLSNVILGGESPNARSARLANSWVLRGDVRPLTEIQADIEQVTLAELHDYVQHRFAFDPVVVTLGPEGNA